MSICNLCGCNELVPLIDFGIHPVSKHYLKNASDVRDNWPVKLYFCASCGLSQLVDSCPPEVIYDDYVTLSSWKPQPQVTHEIETVQRMGDLTPNANIVEIGCNDAMFLEALSGAGYRNLLGVEPSKDAHEIATGKGFEIIPEFLSPTLSESIVEQHGKFDLFVSRQNIEHIRDLKGVINSINILLKVGGLVLIELPNYACNLRCRDYSLWEEHVNYFTIETLTYFLSLCNIEVIHKEIFLFSGEGIFVVGRKTDNVIVSLDYLPSLRKLNLQFADYWTVFRSNINTFLHAERLAGKKIAIYGAGSRATCLINFTGIGAYIDMVLDDQPEKQNRFLPGSKLPIVSGEKLYMERLDICLLAVNTEHENKVIEKHKTWVGNGGKFWSVFPPSDRLLPIW